MFIHSFPAFDFLFAPSPPKHVPTLKPFSLRLNFRRFAPPQKQICRKPNEFHVVSTSFFSPIPFCPFSRLLTSFPRPSSLIVRFRRCFCLFLVAAQVHVAGENPAASHNIPLVPTKDAENNSYSGAAAPSGKSYESGKRQKKTRSKTEKTKKTTRTKKKTTATTRKTKRKTQKTTAKKRKTTRKTTRKTQKTTRKTQKTTRKTLKTTQKTRKQHEKRRKQREKRKNKKTAKNNGKTQKTKAKTRKNDTKNAKNNSKNSINYAKNKKNDAKNAKNDRINLLAHKFANP